jgi:hypothetical protein
MQASAATGKVDNMQTGDSNPNGINDPTKYDNQSGQASAVVVDSQQTNGLQALLTKKPIIITAIVAFAAIATILLVRSYAATTALTKTWKTNTDWTTNSQLDNVAVANNAVSLAVAKSSTTPTSAATTDLARRHTAASSSRESRSLNVNKAFDGDKNTRWASQGGAGTQWIYVDLGAKYNVNRVVLNWETAYAKAYKVQVSTDAAKWTDVYSTQNGTGGVNDLKSLTGSGRYVRMYATVRGTQWGYSLWDFQVYGSQGNDTSTVYAPSGNLSLTFDAGTTTKNVDWTGATAQTTKPTGTNITLSYATSDDNKTWGAANADITKLADSRYLKIVANLQTSNTAVTPTLNSLTLNYAVTTTPAAQPSVTLKASASTVNSGSATTLTWGSSNATACTAGGGWAGSKATSGSASTGNLTATTAFTLTCTGAGGSASANATVTVTTPPVTGGGTSPSGAAIPGAISGYKQVCAEDFTKAAVTGTWGTSDASKVVYQDGCKWMSYPDGWPSTFTGGQVGYAPAKVLSVHDGVLDFSLQNVNGYAAGANPSPMLSTGTSYQQYGQYSFRAKFDKVNGYHAAWLLWPEDDADWQCGETDFPEFGLTDSGITAFIHRSCDGSQDAFSKQIDTSQWHTYSQTWSATSRSFYVDGTLIGTSTKDVFKKPERLQLQTEPEGHQSGGTGHVLVDWVAIYAPN